MASQITMPKLSDTMEVGVILKWLKKEGDRVEPGDVLAEVETDKANMELEVFESGVIRKLFGDEGEGVPIGAVVGILAKDENEDIEALMPSSGGAAAKPAETSASEDKASESPEPDSEEKSAEKAPESPAPQTAPKDSGGASEGGRVKASPVARKLAESKGIDLSTVQGSGPGGRIIKRDVVDLEAPSKGASASAGTPLFGTEGPETTTVALTSMRKIIGRRLAESKFSAPHFYVSMDIDMGKAVALRSELKELDAKFSFNDLVLKATANALVKVPAMNANFDGETITQFKDAHVGFAVAFEGGLITPVVRHANLKSLGQIALETKELISRAKVKKLKPEEYSGGTFTLSNLGMFGVSDFTAIINSPEVGIMAVGGIRNEPVVIDNAVVPGKRMKLTVSTDHRAADGADVAQLLVEIKKILENPSLLLI